MLTCRGGTELFREQCWGSLIDKAAANPLGHLLICVYVVYMVCRHKYENWFALSLLQCLCWVTLQVVESLSHQLLVFYLSFPV